ncbi:MAG: hypothetical protein CMA64_08905 [Euryarchaeota archaeon]|jgi:hypothetical protein|nr:hypothetical protein [Euryarchaeota archaeon]
MAKREYKTASGKRIDFDTLALKGEETIAVGNMGVNARGDKLGEGGEVVKKREEVMADYYRIHNGTIPQDRPIPDGTVENVQPDVPQADSVNVKSAVAKDPILAEVEDENPEDFISSNDLASALASTAQVVQTNEKPAVEVPEEDNHSQDDSEVKSTPEVEEETVSEESIEQPRGGLASAVAKVKTTKPVVKEKTESQQIKDKPGVKRV